MTLPQILKDLDARVAEQKAAMREERKKHRQHIQEQKAKIKVLNAKWVRYGEDKR